MVDIYKWLFGKRGKAALADRAGPADPLTAFRGAIRSTERPIIGIGFGDAEPESQTASRLGGTPWWPMAEPYPRDSNGKPLYLLVQIDFTQTPELAPFPREGLLQIFIGCDDHYGCNFENLREPAGFRCVYHTDLARPALHDFGFLEAHAIDDTGFLPIEQPLRARALTFHPGLMPVDISDYRFETLLPAIAAEERLIEAYGEESDTDALRLGGYPTFTQEDPRRSDNHTDIGDFCLLTVDTTEGVMWGDSGVAQFFMHEADLKRRDFSKVIYNWDCC